jgi:serine-type D-Ala-D-Ala carboxypeptidase (penicillin-binding protein 5/6)
MSFIAAIALATVLGPSNGLRPINVPTPPMVCFPAEAPPAIDATSWMVWSVEDDAELGSFNPDTQRAPASITKLMTAILVAERAALSNTVVISRTADATPIGYVGQPDVRQGEVWTVRDLMVNILVQSGNDAAVALAEHVSGNLPNFITLMNQRATDLGMTRTVFVNPHGLDTSGHLSTARDLIRLGRAGLEHPEILRLSRIKKIDFDPGGRPMELTATNRDLGVFPGLYGLKTGDTLAAGQTFLSYTEGQHDRYLVVVLGSRNRRQVTRELIAWGMTTLGPRDRFFATASGTDLAIDFPEWYLPRVAAARPLPTGDPAPPPSTPLTNSLDDAFRLLLPGVLGGEA